MVCLSDLLWDMQLETIELELQNVLTPCLVFIALSQAKLSISCFIEPVGKFTLQEEAASI